MPDTRAHRGPHPEDKRLFALPAWPALRQAVADLSWLLSRAYGQTSALKIVGDRYDLNKRQRLAVMRCACSDAARARRGEHQVNPAQLRGQALAIDGYNVLTSIEAALAGGVLIRGRDGCVRDMASMHGSYRKVAETLPALTHIGQALAALQPASCTWYLDSPVSNSGRLKAIMAQVAGEYRWAWQIELATNPDQVLIEGNAIVASADSAVLDRAGRWFNLAAHVLRQALPAVQALDLCGE